MSHQINCPVVFIPIILLAIISVAIGQNSDFRFYWNIPTFMCKRHNILFENITKYYGIIQNDNDKFQGNQITIMYDPGMFPAILQNSSSKEYFYRNGGVPQEGDLQKHLEMFQKHVDEMMPDPNFQGLAVIDFESWRPIYRQNFGSLQPYKNMSLRIERYRHPLWQDKRIEREAARRFEKAGRKFMEETLWMGQKLRPEAIWGYYAYPYCFNSPTRPDSCPAYVQNENNNLQWLFDSVDAIFPSVYMNEAVPPGNRATIVAGRVREALRFSNKYPRLGRPPVFVYHRYVYPDTLEYLTEVDTYGILNAIKQNGADGVILWGSSYDLNTRAKCQGFYDYILSTLGPVIQAIQQPTYSVQSVPVQNYYY